MLNKTQAQALNKENGTKNTKQILIKEFTVSELKEEEAQWKNRKHMIMQFKKNKIKNTLYKHNFNTLSLPFTLIWFLNINLGVNGLAM